jgi:hypothetical protein
MLYVRAISFTFHLIHKRNGENDQQNGRVNLLRLLPSDISLLMFLGGGGKEWKKPKTKEEEETGGVCEVKTRDERTEDWRRNSFLLS